MVTALRQDALNNSGVGGVQVGPSVADTNAAGGTIVAPTAPAQTTTSTATPTAVVSSDYAVNDLNNISKTVDDAHAAITAQSAKNAASQTPATGGVTTGGTTTGGASGGASGGTQVDMTVQDQPDPGFMFIYDKATGTRSEVPVGLQVPTTSTTIDLNNAPATDTVQTSTTTFKQFSDGTYGMYDASGKYIGPATAQNFADAKGYQKSRQDLISIQNGTYPLTPGQQAQIDSLTKYYEDLIEQQKVINANVTGNTTGLQNLYGVGGTVVGVSEVNRSIQEGAAKIAEINRKMVEAITSLRSAIQTDNINLVTKLYTEYKDAVDSKQKQIDDMQSAVVSALSKQAQNQAGINDAYAKKYMDTTTPILPTDSPEQLKAKLESSPTYQQDLKTKAGMVDQDVLDGMIAIYRKTGAIPAGMGNASVALKKAFYAKIGGQSSLVDEATTNKAAIAAATKALTNQQTQLSATQTSIETMKKSLDLVDELNKKVDKSGAPVVNKYLLWLKGQAQGDANTAALNAAILTASTEYAKIMSGASASIAGVTVSSAEDVKNALNSALSKGQIESVMNVMRQDANYRVTSQQGTVNQIKSDLNDLDHIGSTSTDTGGGSGGGNSSSDPLGIF